MQIIKTPHCYQHIIFQSAVMYKPIQTIYGNTKDRTVMITSTREPSGWQACCDNCRRNSRCISWTWHDPAKWRGGALCRLFNRMPSSSASPREINRDPICTSGYTIRYVVRGASDGMASSPSRGPTSVRRARLGRYTNHVALFWTVDYKKLKKLCLM